jgi:hypothetical protein
MGELMANQQRDETNRFTMGRNRRKTQDKQPDFNGKMNVDGKEYWLSAWIQTNGKDGSKFFAGTVRPVEDSAAKPATSRPGAAVVPAADDDIPF